MNKLFFLMGLFIIQSNFAAAQVENGEFEGRTTGLFSNKCSIKISESADYINHHILSFSARVGCRGPFDRCYHIGENFSALVSSREQTFINVRQRVAPSGNLIRTQSTIDLTLDQNGRPMKAKFVQTDESLTPGQTYKESISRSCKF